MGYFKEAAEKASERGWSSIDRHICANCLAEPTLAHIVADAAVAEQECSFCSAYGAASFEIFMDAFMSGIRNEYDHAVNEVPWDSAEGGFHSTETWDSWDLVQSFDYVFEGNGVLEAVLESVHDNTWVDQNFRFRKRDIVLNEAWEKFCAAIKHRTRFVFWLTADEEPAVEEETYGEVASGRILHHVGSLLQNFDLIRDLPGGTILYRARTHANKGDFDLVAKQLGTAPASIAGQGNRMSPAGIPMFYACESPDAALSEAGVRTENDLASIGVFTTIRDCQIVDLTQLPEVPSIFDPNLGNCRRELAFLNQFSDAISQPAREGYDQIDYVPTQVLTEYLLRVRWGSGKIAGMRYRSSASKAESAIVLDISNDDCLDKDESISDDRLQVILEKTLTYGAKAIWVEIE